MEFKYEFRKFTEADRERYVGFLNLPNGEVPKIFDMSDGEDPVVMILSGDGIGNSIVSILHDNKQYDLFDIPGYNMCLSAIADSMIEYFYEYSNTEEVVDKIVSEYGMTEYNDSHYIEYVQEY